MYIHLCIHITFSLFIYQLMASYLLIIVFQVTSKWGYHMTMVYCQLTVHTKLSHLSNRLRFLPPPSVDGEGHRVC
jgi:hypothetical protein